MTPLLFYLNKLKQVNYALEVHSLLHPLLVSTVGWLPVGESSGESLITFLTENG